MKVFDTLPAEGRELVHPVGGWDALINLLDGTPRKRTWRPVKVNLVTKEKNGRVRARSECPWLCLDFALVFREDALIKLGDFLSRTGEILPLDCDEARLHIWQPLTLVDAVDPIRSEIHRFESGRIMQIQRYAFIPEKIVDLDAFKTPDMKARPVFFSDKAREHISTVLGHDIQFRLRWSSE